MIWNASIDCPRLSGERYTRADQAAAFEASAIRSSDAAEVADFAQQWPARFGHYPHVAAGATIQRYKR